MFEVREGWQSPWTVILNCIIIFTVYKNSVQCNILCVYFHLVMSVISPKPDYPCYWTTKVIVLGDKIRSRAPSSDPIHCQFSHVRPFDIVAKERHSSLSESCCQHCAVVTTRALAARMKRGGERRMGYLFFDLFYGKIFLPQVQLKNIMLCI